METYIPNDVNRKGKLIFCSTDDLFSGAVSKYSEIIMIIKIILTNFLLASTGPPNEYYLLVFITFLLTIYFLFMSSINLFQIFFNPFFLHYLTYFKYCEISFFMFGWHADDALVGPVKHES